MDKHEYMKEWDSSLLNIENLRGRPGQTDSEAILVHKMGKNTIEIRERVELNNLPEEYIVVYEANKVWNRIVHRFITDKEGEVRWVFDCEFKCTGILYLMTLLMPGMFKKRSKEYMDDYAAFVQREASKQ